MHGLVNKMSKENFEALPFPSFSKNELTIIRKMVEDFINEKISESVLQKFVYDFFEIIDEEQNYILKNIN